MPRTKSIPQESRIHTVNIHVTPQLTAPQLKRRLPPCSAGRSTSRPSQGRLNSLVIACLDHVERASEEGSDVPEHRHPHPDLWRSVFRASSQGRHQRQKHTSNQHSSSKECRLRHLAYRFHRLRSLPPPLFEITSWSVKQSVVCCSCLRQTMEFQWKKRLYL